MGVYTPSGTLEWSLCHGWICVCSVDWVLVQSRVAPFLESVLRRNCFFKWSSTSLRAVVTSSSDAKIDGFSSFVRSSPFSNLTLGWLRQVLLTGLSIGLLWLPGSASGTANAAPRQTAELGGEVASWLTNPPVRIVAWVLSRLTYPINWARTASNERWVKWTTISFSGFYLKVNPKPSQPEGEL